MLQKRREVRKFEDGVFWRIPVRALLGSLFCAVVGGLFTTVCGAILSFAWNAPWAFLYASALRGVLSGLAAGAIVGAVSGFYHVEGPLPKASPSDNRRPSLTNGKGLPAAPPAAHSRSEGAGQQPLNAGASVDYKEHLWN